MTRKATQNFILPEQSQIISLTLEPQISPPLASKLLLKLYSKLKTALTVVILGCR